MAKGLTQRRDDEVELLDEEILGHPESQQHEKRHPEEDALLKVELTGRR